MGVRYFTLDSKVFPTAYPAIAKIINLEIAESLLSLRDINPSRFTFLIRREP